MQGLIRKAWRVKNTRARGFSILEMTIVLGIVAATSIAGIKVLNGKIEQNAIDRVVADLTIVTEAAYECYATGRCKGVNGWEPVEDEKASIHLDSFLPQGFFANYKVRATEVIGTETSKLVIRAVNLPSKRIAQRIANTFGSQAQVAQKDVEVTLGIPQLVLKPPTSCTVTEPYKKLGRSNRYPKRMEIGEHRSSPVIEECKPLVPTESCPTDSDRNCTRRTSRPNRSQGTPATPNITRIGLRFFPGYRKVIGRRCDIDGTVYDTEIFERCRKRCPIPLCGPVP